MGSSVFIIRFRNWWVVGCAQGALKSLYYSRAVFSSP